MNFEFKYWDRWYSVTLMWKAIQLLFTGGCTIQVHMDKPRDIAWLTAAEAAMAKYDRCEREATTGYDA